MSSFSMDCFRSFLKASEYPVFSHMKDKKKAKRVLNEMKYLGFILDRTQIIFSPRRARRTRRGYKTILLIPCFRNLTLKFINRPIDISDSFIYVSSWA